VRTIAISGLALARVLVGLAYAVLAILLLTAAVWLAFAGYVVFLVGFTKGALFLWAGACLALVTVGVTGALVPKYIRRIHPMEA
jgi:hypothetical protein